jgi:EAL domain-containing protein (putative c-di-GMP-specific phosphodiesterase class I)
MTREGCDKLHWIRSAYGAEASAALSSLGPTQEPIERAVRSFYETLDRIPAARAVIDNLTPEEFRHLRGAQGRYLATILSPDLSAAEHRQAATKNGLRHFCVGVSSEILAAASVLYTDIAAGLISGVPDDDEVRSVVTRRLQNDFITQIEAYALIHRDRLAVREKIAQQTHMAHPLDFVQATLDTLLGSLNEDLAGIALGGVKNGNYRHLLAGGRVPCGAVGPLLTEYPTITAPEIQQNWFNEQPLVVNSLYRDTQLPQAWRGECLSLGIRSLGLFVMHDLQGVPKSALMICSGSPGYFLNDETPHYWQQMGDLIGVNLDFMERSRIRRRHRLADGLRYRQLLAQGHVEIHYQPIVEPRTGRTVKVEALARLEEGGETIAPGVFLAAFGANQLRELFEIGLVRAIDDLSNLPGKHPVCSINLPPEAMHDSAWLKALPETLSRLRGDPGSISLEILESALSDDKEVQDALAALKESGYSILLDDVGAGESSLLRLVTLPVTGIKIDQAFVRSLQDSFEHLDLLLSLRSVAALRGLECVAEGVETDDIVDILGSVDGMLLQGYAYSRPLPAEALSEWLALDDGGEPVAPFPRSLYGWYSRHAERIFSMRNALSTIGDLVSLDYLEDAERCPLHSILPSVGGDAEVEEAHRRWHASYTQFAVMIREGASAVELWHSMESSKREMRVLVERKLRSDVASQRTKL